MLSSWFPKTNLPTPESLVNNVAVAEEYLRGIDLVSHRIQPPPTKCQQQHRYIKLTGYKAGTCVILVLKKKYFKLEVGL